MNFSNGTVGKICSFFSKKKPAPQKKRVSNLYLADSIVYSPEDTELRTKIMLLNEKGFDTEAHVTCMSMVGLVMFRQELILMRKHIDTEDLESQISAEITTRTNRINFGEFDD